MYLTAFINFKQPRIHIFKETLFCSSYQLLRVGKKQNASANILENDLTTVFNKFKKDVYFSQGWQVFGV